MRLALFSLAVGLAQQAAAVGVVGAAEGFAKGVTGGGSATPVYPSTIAELTKYLADDTARVIVLNKEFNYIGSEGTTTEKGCRPASNKCPGNGGQDAINHASWCDNGNAGTGSTSITVKYDTAGVSGLTVGSNKSIIGVGSKGVIRGKGLRMANGAKNVIIQNIHITELNPQYIFGGDAITLDGTDMIWVDHVKVSKIGRQFVVLGNGASGRVSITNSEFDGYTDYSATCDGHHYWALYFTGSSDMVTFKANYIHHTSGRSPKVGGNTLLHAVNNYWYANSGHAFDIGSSNSNAVIEGNVFQNVVTPLLENKGKVFAPTSVQSTCSTYLGHSCQANAFGSSGSLTGTDSSFLSNFKGKNVASASAASTVASAKYGVGIVA
ncbi:putative pectin lyase a precursor protein [Lasiodiplodia theobromae]|uniref:pectin lyase n=2 Tax=Lasiodiplodia TaxID=66739 RepID=A0A5N5DB42_9PEZI|nr:Pectin lyase [Lasiodiplodia theobromae]KAB2575063.1 Pectin lyase B [Lasiodiplodia theobromae]KAF4538876.1 Pectin lyase [Lasiodiplodia theobromae]KAF9637435.1 putative pectin lyase a precursor protein [Lasiodiplodia theobromae]KAK0647603.1 Pectin lyase B [Lasiodiplodia hormozganensis]